MNHFLGKANYSHRLRKNQNARTAMAMRARLI
jgi:hypothetical protein